MKRFPGFMAVLALAVLVMAGCGASAESLNNEGNKAFAEQDFENARLAYQQAQGESPEMAEPHYNEANTHYRQGNYEGAQQKIEQALVGEERVENLDQNSYYNLGNTFFQAEQYQAAIEVYKEALRLNPDDLQAKQNLELALRQLQQQQEQQDQENQDQQDEQQQDEQNQDQENQDQQDDQQQDQENQDQQEGQGEGQPKEITGLTEEQARQLLEAAAENTESLEEFLQQILVVSGRPPVEDW